MSVIRSDDIAAAVRAVASQSVIVMIDAGLDPLALAAAKAVIAPLAIERTPARINAIVQGVNADPDAVAATIAFLEDARSTTGQMVEIV